MKLKLLPLLSIFLYAFANAQTSVQLSASEIKLRLERLAVTGSVLYIAAHPDDENTRLLSYLSTERKVRTGYLSLTRGDGGQNLIGSEQAEQLGLIRTQELLAARKIDGAEQFFTRANDFGFSKTSTETFKIWDKEKILGDVVWIIRKFRPDVIITRFPGDARAGHGQHAASSIIAQEAFLAAADPSRFPAQLDKVKPWKTKRIFWNTFNSGVNNTSNEDQLKIDAGVYNFLLGKSYGEIASESRSQHKSQGFGVARQRGEAMEYFTSLNGEPAAKDILEGIETTWLKFKGGKEIQTQIEKLNKNFEVKEPQKSLPDLIKLYTLIQQVDDIQLKERKLAELTDLILSAGGIWMEAYSNIPSVAVGDNIPLKIQAISRADDEIKLSISMNENKVISNAELPKNLLKSFDATASAKAITQPYWLAEKHPIGEYTIKDQDVIGRPENPAPVTLSFTLTAGHNSFTFQRPVVYKFIDPIRGEVYQNLEITPPVITELQTPSLIFTDKSKQQLSVKIRAFKDAAAGELKLNLPYGWKAFPEAYKFNLANKGDEQVVTFEVNQTESDVSGKLKVHVNLNGDLYSKSIKTIQYNHIPTITWFPESEANLIKLDVKTAGTNIAFIPGAGDLVPDALKQIGYKVTTLTVQQIENTDLSQFDAIITGVRLYNINQQVKHVNDKLLKYVENGGVLLVQYNVNQPLVMNNIGPYPFSVTRDRVTEEDAKVTILNPAHRIFNFPNKITERDFDNWIQERGIYFVNNADPHYELPLSMKDTGEQEQKGSLVICNYGKGRFVYTGLVFFRELPAAVPGAYRFFVNLISK